MTMVEKIEKEYKEKQPIFKKIFNLPCKDIKKIIGKILNDYQIDFCLDSSRVIKKIINDEPDTITLEWYDQIEISFMGVYFKPEHKSRYLITRLYNDFLEE